VSAPDLAALRLAGRIAAAARAAGVRHIAAGRTYREACVAVQAEIERRGGALAFPVQVAVNEVAAHDCPADGDARVFVDGDLAKLDLGVHVDGWVVDTATTVSVGDWPQRRRFVTAAEQALAAAVDLAGPYVPVDTLARAIEAALKEAGCKPIRNLCGHGVGRWIVHSPPPIPNQSEGDTQTRLMPGSTVALEVFATDGEGRVAEAGQARIFRVDPLAAGSAQDAEIAAVLRALNGLPFSVTQLGPFSAARIESALSALEAAGRLRAYRPLVESPGALVAQVEHTLHVGSDGVEVLTAD
jgi:methionyl aminopeptidase